MRVGVFVLGSVPLFSVPPLPRLRISPLDCGFNTDIIVCCSTVFVCWQFFERNLPADSQAWRPESTKKTVWQINHSCLLQARKFWHNHHFTFFSSASFQTGQRNSTSHEVEPQRERERERERDRQTDRHCEFTHPFPFANRTGLEFTCQSQSVQNCPSVNTSFPGDQQLTICQHHNSTRQFIAEPHEQNRNYEATLIFDKQCRYQTLVTIIPIYV